MRHPAEQIAITVIGAVLSMFAVALVQAIAQVMLQEPPVIKVETLAGWEVVQTK